MRMIRFEYRGILVEGKKRWGICVGYFNIITAQVAAPPNKENAMVN